MVLLQFSEAVLEDMKLLPSLQPQVFSEFVNIALQNILEGSVPKRMYAKAAGSHMLPPTHRHTIFLSFFLFSHHISFIA